MGIDNMLNQEANTEKLKETFLEKSNSVPFSKCDTRNERRKYERKATFKFFILHPFNFLQMEIYLPLVNQERK